MADGSAPEWQGINHLALVTTDMDATVRFYHGVLGADLVATIGAPGFRHYFFDLGPGCTVAFFEYRDQPLERFAKPAGIPDARAIQFDHVSFNLADEAALEALRARLAERGCEVTEVVDHQIMRSIYFTDNNGIALEASCWMRDTSAPGSYDDPELFGDHDPVPAVRELAAAGALGRLPRTHLVDGPTTIADPA